MPLKLRKGFPPGGWQFFQPETGWSAPFPLADGFDKTVSRIINHRLANPRFPFATDYNTVADQLDKFTCHRLKFDPHYCDGVEADKKKDVPRRIPQNRPLISASLQTLQRKFVEAVTNVKRSAVGARILNDWIGHGSHPVAQPIAERRGATCAACPLNSKEADWMFGIPKAVAVAIHEHRRVKSQLALKVSMEDQLGTCTACGCQNALAVWVPIQHIRKLTPKDIAAKLDKNCWKLNEP
jgi:hypothetical protein